MSCDQVAVVGARLEADAAVEILAAPAARDALRAWVGRELGPCTVVRADAGALQLALAGRSPLTLALTRAGLVVSGPDRAGAADAAQRLEAFTRELAAAAVRERLVAALRRRYAVTADERGPGGARTLTLSL